MRSQEQLLAEKAALAQHVENDEIKLEALQIRNKEMEILVMNLKDECQQLEVCALKLQSNPCWFVSSCVFVATAARQLQLLWVSEAGVLVVLFDSSTFRRRRMSCSRRSATRRRGRAEGS